MTASSNPEADAQIRRVREVIDRLFLEREVVARADGSLHTLFPVALPAAEGQALREWVKREQATRTIEIGLGYGISTLFICEGLLANGGDISRHLAVDPHQSTSFVNCGLQVLDEGGVGELVEHHAEESATVLPRFLTEGRRFDLAFVDGNHRFDGVFLDLVYLGRLVRPGGIVVVDDHQLPSIARATSFCTTNLGWSIEEMSTDDPFHHWAVLRTSNPALPRAFDHYVAF